MKVSYSGSSFTVNGQKYTLKSRIGSFILGSIVAILVIPITVIALLLGMIAVLFGLSVVGVTIFAVLPVVGIFWFFYSLFTGIKFSDLFKKVG